MGGGSSTQSKQNQEMQNILSQNQIKNLEQQIVTRTNTNKEISMKLAKNKQIEEKKIEQLQHTQKILNQQQTQSNNLDSEIRGLQSQLRKYKHQLERLQKIREKEIRQAQQRLTDQAAANLLIRKAEDLIKRKEQQLQQLKGSLESTRQQRIRREQQIKDRQIRMHELTRNKNQMQIHLKMKESQVKKIRQESQNLIQQDKNLQIEMTKYNAQIMNKDRQIHRLNQIKLQLNDQIGKINLQQKQQQNYSQERSQDAPTPLFTGDVLLDYQQYKTFIAQTLQNRLGRQIKGTKLIYRYDELNQVNFHNYIDKNSQLVILIKLTNGFYLGAWVEGQFQPRTTSDKSGLIFSLTNRRVFELKQKNRRAIAYDDYFLIVGNSEIRLRSQNKKVYSNFAVSNGYFDSKGEKVDILLGSGGAREVEMQTFEVFQLKF